MKRPLEVPELNPLSRTIGTLVEFLGFKKIHGVIWTHMYLSSTPLSATDLVTRLRVSKALISLSLKDLLGHRLIRQVEQDGNRKTKYYAATPDFSPVLRTLLANRELRLITSIVDGCRQLEQELTSSPENQSVDPIQLKTLENLAQRASWLLRLLTQNTETGIPDSELDLLKAFFKKK